MPSLRGTHVASFPLLKQLSSELETEAEVFLTLLIKLISGETEAGEPRPGWMRVLAIEIMRGCAFPLYLISGILAYQ
jgi:Guanine nucleotide exchange factor in Golgi transport N-terminal